MAIRKRAAPRATQIGKFPDCLYDLSKAHKCDEWFLQKWGCGRTTNRPPNLELGLAAKMLARATMRQAWLNFNGQGGAQEPYTWRPTYEQIKKLNSANTSALKALQFLRDTASYHPEMKGNLAANILSSVFLSTLQDDPDIGGEQPETIADAITDAITKGISQLLVFQQVLNEKLVEHRNKLQGFGKPEIVAFVVPFLEAHHFMTGELPGKTNKWLLGCLADTWSFDFGLETVDVPGEAMIRSALRIPFDATINSEKVRLHVAAWRKSASISGHTPPAWA